MLKRYCALVGYNEGVDFLDHYDDDFFTLEEWKELQAISEEANRGGRDPVMLDELVAKAHALEKEVKALEHDLKGMRDRAFDGISGGRYPDGQPAW